LHLRELANSFIQKCYDILICGLQANYESAEAIHERNYSNMKAVFVLFVCCSLFTETQDVNK